MITKRKYSPHTKTKIVSARMPVPLINKIDKLCKETNRTCSDIINQILNEFVDKLK